MKYDEYIEQVKSKTILINNDIEEAFVNPDWKYILITEDLSPYWIDGLDYNFDDIKDILEKTCAEYNMRNSHKSELQKMLYDICVGGLKNEIDEDNLKLLRELLNYKNKKEKQNVE